MTGQPAQTFSDGPAPIREVLRMVLGQHVAAVVSTMTRLELPDLLGEGPRTVEGLAIATGANPAGLRRLLRAAASLALVDQVDDDTFAGNRLSDCLRRRPGSLRDIALAMSEPSHSRLLERLGEAVGNHQAVAAGVLGSDIWTYRDSHPQARIAMTERLVDVETAVLPLIKDRLDLASVRRIVAVGGNQGQFLAALLAQAPQACGVLFDRPQVIARARHTIESVGLGDRVSFVGGDFLQKVPPGGDLYVLKGVLHDVDDEAATWLLDSCYMASTPHGTLLALEGILPAGPPHDPIAQLIDINALLTVNGRERTVEEFEELFNGSGYRLVDTIRLPSVQFRQYALLVGDRS